MNFDGKTVVITGGTSGIGEELVKQLTSRCREIVVLARNQRLLNSLSDQYDNVTCYACNLDKRSELESVVQKVINIHPDVSILINNAGIQNTPEFLDDDFNFDGIETEIKINLTSPIWLTALFLGHFLEHEEETSFININSGLAIYPKTSSAVYCATKAGLRGFTKSLRYQLEETTISIYEVIMPIVDTPMTRGRRRKKMKVENAAKELIKGVEAGRSDIYVGISRLIPIVARLSPKLMAGMLKKG